MNVKSFFHRWDRRAAERKKINSHVELVLKFQRDWETVSRLLICTFSWFYDQEKNAEHVTKSKEKRRPTH